MIKLRLQRAHRTLRPEPPREIEKISSVTEVSEKILKGKAIANTVK